MEVEATTSRQGLRSMAIGALVGVLALMAYLFIGSRNETMEVQKLLTAKVEQFASTQIKLDSIATVLDAKIIEVRQLGGSVTELERIRKQLENDKRKLKSDLSFSVQQYNLKINDYRAFLVSNEIDIQKLKDENGSLRNRTRVLEQEKQTIMSENEDLRSEKEALTQTVEDYSLQNADLKNKITLAAALKAVDIDVNAFSSGGRERRGGIYKASRIDRLKVSFILPANPVAQKGYRDIYLRILDPYGAVINEGGIGGVLWYDGREIGYTSRQNVLFESNDQRVDLLFRREATYKPGYYSVELYAEGFRIGESHFEVK